MQTNHSERTKRILYSTNRHDRDYGFVNDLTLDLLKKRYLLEFKICRNDHGLMTLDRIDNNKGHSKDNVNAACWECNSFRKNMSYEAWLIIAKEDKIKRKRIF